MVGRMARHATKPKKKEQFLSLDEFSEQSSLPPEQIMDLVKKGKIQIAIPKTETALVKTIHTLIREIKGHAKQLELTDYQLHEWLDKLKKGVKDVATFSTYLDYWLVQHMNRWLQEHSRTIRIPFNRWGEISEYHHAHERLTKELEREPEIEEMAEYMGKSVKEIEGFFKFPNTTPLDRKVRDQHGSSDSTLSDFISCGDMDVTKAAEALFREDLLGKIFEPLTTRERIIVKLRFGIKDDEVPETLEEVGIRFKLTRERIRQIEFKALQKLRKNQQSRKYLKRLAA